MVIDSIQTHLFNAFIHDISSAEESTLASRFNRRFPPRKLSIKFRDKFGINFRVDYYKFPKFGIDKALQFNEIAALKKQFIKLIKRAFPNYSQSDLSDLLSKVDRAKYLDFVFSEKGKLVAFHIYKIDFLELKMSDRKNSACFKFKAIFVDHTATDPDFEGRGVGTNSRHEVIKVERPDLICGTSANGGIYVVAKRIAEIRDLLFYPTSNNTPEYIYRLANFVHTEMSLFNAKLDHRLVRTYPEPVTQGKRPHPLENKIRLSKNQHIFYMAATDEICRVARRIWGQSSSSLIF